MSSDKLSPGLKVVLHAPTSGALQRARNNAMNLKKARPGVEVRIIVNAEAVATALDIAHPETDSFTAVCPNTLARLNRQVREPLRVLDAPAILELAQLQENGWVYIRS